MRENFKRDLLKIDILEFKNLSRPLKLGSYVLGIKTQIIYRAEF